MLMPIKSRSGLKLGYVGSETRSVEQILGKPCVHYRGHSLEQKFMKLCQNVNSHTSRLSSKLGHIGSKTRSLGQIMKKTFCTLERAQFWSKVQMLIFIKSGSVSKHWNIVHVTMPTQAYHSFLKLWLHCPYHFYANIRKITWIFLLYR